MRNELVAAMNRVVRCNGVAVGASASQSVNCEFISFVESYQKFFKMIFTASLPSAQQGTDSV